MGAHTIQWSKGHGTQNDFVLLWDADGTRHSDLGPETVRLLCDRRRGVGADGVLRVVRTSAEPAAAAHRDAATWFMDFRNADGSVGEMCGNGVRVFARFLADSKAVNTAHDLPVATRGGLKWVGFRADGLLTVDMERVSFPPADGLVVSAGDVSWPAVAVDVSNPHAVAFVADLAALGPELRGVSWHADLPVFPEGVNVEFAVHRQDRHLAMRVHERGVGETWSCGTGACAVAAAAARAEGIEEAVNYQVDVPGGRLDVTLDADGVAWLIGPAEVRLSGTITVD